MRVLLEGGSSEDRRAVADALRRGGCALARPGEPSDHRLLLLPRAQQPLALDPVRGVATVAGRTVRLTRIEQSLLTELSAGARDRRTLLERVWGYAFDPGTNLVAVHVSRLRTKLGPDTIVHDGASYRLHLPQG